MESNDSQRFEKYLARHSEYCSREKVLEKWECWARNRIWTVGDLIEELSKLDKDKYIEICDRYHRISDIYQINNDPNSIRLQIEDGLMMEQDV